MLFNLACSWVTTGCDADRDDAKGAKVAAHAFQNAAGVFTVLEQIAEKATVTKTNDAPTMDTSKECTAALVQLCLAQAQKCVFDKASRDGKSVGVLVKLARQCHLFYAAAKTALEQAPLCDHVDKSWRAHIEAMSSLHFAEAEVAACAALARAVGGTIGVSNSGSTRVTPSSSSPLTRRVGSRVASALSSKAARHVATP